MPVSDKNIVKYFKRGVLKRSVWKFVTKIRKSPRWTGRYCRAISIQIKYMYLKVLKAHLLKFWLSYATDKSLKWSLLIQKREIENWFMKVICMSFKKTWQMMHHHGSVKKDLQENAKQKLIWMWHGVFWNECNIWDKVWDSEFQGKY